jgi:hypothetical protein
VPPLAVLGPLLDRVQPTVHPRQFVLLDAVEARQAAPQETLQSPTAASDSKRGHIGVRQEGLGSRVFA